MDSFCNNLGSILIRFGLHFGSFWLLLGASEATLGPQGGPEGPRVEFDAIVAPIWGPLWDIFWASGIAFGGQENRVILKTLFDRIWVRFGLPNVLRV